MSKESEVKDIEWLRKEFNGLFNGKSILTVGRSVVDEILNQLDEPEVLSQEWIDKNKRPWTNLQGTKDYIAVSKLQNLLVPKQEKVEVPRFVADILEENTFADLPTAFEELFSANAGHYYGEDVCKWIVANDELFARAWLDSFTVEEEQKYYVLDKDNIIMIGKVTNGKVMKRNFHTPFNNFKESAKEKAQLTEQEIKDYDERYWPFAVKVEEVE